MNEVILYLSNHTLEALGTSVGLLYLYLEYKASIWLWLAGIVMPAIYIKIYLDSGLYADMGINIYYLIVSIYGWLWWYKSQLSKQQKTQDDSPSRSNIVHTKGKEWIVYILATIGLFILIGWGLKMYTDSTVPWLDSLTTALSIIGMWQLARKQIEQWFTWIIVDLICVGLYHYKGLELTALLYLFYTVIAFFGYKRWQSMMHKDYTTKRVSI